MKIKQFFLNQTIFSFSHTNHEDIESIIESLNNRSACSISNIPPKMFKEHIDIFSIKLYNDFNQLVADSIFPENCKLADITPAHKKDSKIDKNNYRPVKVYSQQWLKFLRDYFLINLLNILIISSLNFNAVLENYHAGEMEANNG